MNTKYLLFMLLFIQFGCNNITGVFDDSNGTTEQQPVLGNITLSVDKSIYTADDTIHIKLLNSDTVPVFLEGCSQLFIETKVDTGWVNAPLWVCVWEGFAVKILTDSSYVLDYPAEYFLGTHRFMAPLYFGCKDGEPISSGECNRREVIYSTEFVVRK